MGIRRTACVLAAVLAWLIGGPGEAAGQPPEPQRASLSDAVSIELADNRAMTHLKQAREYLVSQEWDNAVAKLQYVIEAFGDGLVKLEEVPLGSKDSSSRRYVSIRRFCQLRLTALPPEALKRYRGLVDARVEGDFKKAARTRDRRKLLKIIESSFCSSVGDDALLLLGDMALEQGDYAAARGYWQRIIPLRAKGTFDIVSAADYQRVRDSGNLSEADAQLLEAWYPRNESDEYHLRGDKQLPPEAQRRLARLWISHGVISVLKYPDEPDAAGLAGIDARLVLASIMEGSLARAGREVKRFAELHPKAEGRLRGGRVVYADALKQLLAESRDWPKPVRRTDWLTFGGSNDRNGVLPGEIEIARLAWTVPLPKIEIPDPRISANRGFRPRRVAEDNKQPLSIHPVVVDGKVLFTDGQRVYAFKLSDGKPAWPTAADPTSGVFYPPNSAGADKPLRRAGYLGAPRYTLTAHGDKVFVRMGSPVTSSIETGNQRPGSYLRWFDLANEGNPLHTIEAPEDWAFDGSPVTDGSRIYVAQRRRGTTARTRVLCYDAENERLVWQRSICGADTPGRGQVDEVTHNLLTLHQDTVYFNTNLGAVAALSARDGAIDWITTYPRARLGVGHDFNRRPGHFYRDLTPCLYHNGMLYVAPSDHVGILAIVADTGQIVWDALDQNRDDGDTAVHLLGARGNYLVASGDKFVWWFDIQKQDARPSSGAADGEALLNTKPREKAGNNTKINNPFVGAYGRGVIVGGYVYVPSREHIHVFRHQTPPKTPEGNSGAGPPIKLRPHQAGGGNLIATDTHLLVVGTNTLYGFELARPLSKAAKAKAAKATPANP